MWRAGYGFPKGSDLRTPSPSAEVQERIWEAAGLQTSWDADAKLSFSSQMTERLS